MHDIYTNRILEVLSSMQTITLHALPENREKPWPIEVFYQKIEEACRTSAVELHRKSLMIEEAVEEILSLVKKARVNDSLLESEEMFPESKFCNFKYILTSIAYLDCCPPFIYNNFQNYIFISLKTAMKSKIQINLHNKLTGLLLENTLRSLI